VPFGRVKLTRASVTRLVAAGASAAALTFLTTPAKAEVLLFAANSANYIQTITRSGDFADFNGPAAGGKSYSFQTSQANQRVLITFEATCYERVPQTVGVNILVDPAGSVGEFAAPPTNSDYEGGVILCGHHLDDLGIHVTHTSITASARPAQAGTHSVRVRVWLAGVGTFEPQVQIGTALLGVSR
jgi:hypothetical protein